MQRKLKFQTLPIFLLGFVSLLVSCGSPASSETGSSTDSGDTIKIEFWHASGADLAKSFTKAGKSFAALVKEHENVNVEVEVTYGGGYSDIRTNVLNGFAVGSVPTIAVAYPDTVADFLAADKSNSGYVCDLSKYANDETIGFGKETWLNDGPSSDIIDTFYKEGSCYGKEGMYSLPFMKSSEVLFYNYERVAAYGRNYTPKGFSGPLNSATSVKSFMANLTWDQLMDFSRYIKEQDTEKNYYSPLIYDSDDNLYITQSMQRKIPFTSLDSDGTLSADFNNDQAKAMVSELKQDYDDGLITTKGTNGTYGSNDFIKEKCVFTIGSTGGTDYNTPSDFTAIAVKAPFSNDNPTYVSQGPTLTVLNNPGLSSAKNALATKYAFKFIKYLTGAELNTTMCLNDSAGYVPVRASAYKTTAFTEWLEENKTSLSGMAASVVTEQLSDKYFNTVAAQGSSTARTEVGGIITNVFAGKKTINDAFQSAYAQTCLAAGKKG